MLSWQQSILTQFSHPAVPQDLGSKDLKRERLFLVCQIIRVGRMDLRESLSRKLSTGLRRPFGISGEGGSGWTPAPHQPHGQLPYPDPHPHCSALFPPCSLFPITITALAGTRRWCQQSPPEQGAPCRGECRSSRAPPGLTNAAALGIDPLWMGLVGNYRF